MQTNDVLLFLVNLCQYRLLFTQFVLVLTSTLLVSLGILQFPNVSNFSNFYLIHHDAVQIFVLCQLVKILQFFIHPSRRSPPCHS